MSEQALVSLILPVHNAGPFLHETLDSILRQTYSNIEIVCVDDGSTDDSFSVLKRYAGQDRRVRVIRQENSGAAMARHHGFTTASGEWLCFVDADDWLGPIYVSSLLDTATQTGANMVMCQTVATNERQLTSCPPGAPDRLVTDFRESYSWFIRQWIPASSREASFVPIAVWSKLIHRSLFDGIDWVKANYSAGNDLPIMRQLFQNESLKLALTESVCYNYHVSLEGTLSSTKTIVDFNTGDIMSRLEYEVERHRADDDFATANNLDLHAEALLRHTEVLIHYAMRFWNRNELDQSDLDLIQRIACDYAPEFTDDPSPRLSIVATDWGLDLDAIQEFYRVVCALGPTFWAKTEQLRQEHAHLTERLARVDHDQENLKVSLKHYQDTLEDMRNSWSYRLGYLGLTPVRMLRQLLASGREPARTTEPTM